MRPKGDTRLHTAVSLKDAEVWFTAAALLLCPELKTGVSSFLVFKPLTEVCLQKFVQLMNLQRLHRLNLKHLGGENVFS